MHTLGKLLDYHKDNQSMKQTVAGEYLFNQIQFFEKKNGKQIEETIKFMVALDKEFFEHDEVGTLQFDGVGKDRKPRSKEGKSLSEYQEARQKYLSTPCRIIFR